MQHVIEILMQATPGDPDFYSRWRKIAPVRLKEVGLHIPKARMDEVTVLVLDFRTEVNDALLALYPSVRWIVSPTTGLTHIKADLAAHGVTLLSLKGEREFLNGIRSVAEFTFRQILTLARPTGGFGRLLSGSTLGVIGMGRIGSQVAELGEAFGMKVIGADKDSKPIRWEMLYRYSDFITLHVDENESSRGLVGEKEFALMKPTAFLINTSRPSIIDQPALLAALRGRQIAGAALDLWDGEVDFGGMNARLSFHVAGATVQDRIRTDDFMAGKLKRALKAGESKSSPRKRARSRS